VETCGEGELRVGGGGAAASLPALFVLGASGGRFTATVANVLQRSNQARRNGSYCP